MIDKIKIETVVNILLILFLPIMSYATIQGMLVNMSFADPIFLIAGLFLLFRIRTLFKDKNWIYILYFAVFVLSIFVSQFFSARNEAIFSASNMVMLSEIIKVLAVGGYFYIGYIFIKNEKIYRSACYAISLGSIPVAIIGVAAYIAFALDIPFFIDSFAITGGRLIGTFEDPNLYGLYLILVFYVSIWNAKIAKSKKLSYFMIGISALSMMLIILTMSRGTWVSFVCSLVVFLALNIRALNKYSSLIGLVFMILFFFGLQLDHSFFEARTTRETLNRIEASLIQGDNIDRFHLSRAALEMGNDNFLVGVGAGAFPLNSHVYLGEDHIAHRNQYIPHNTLASVYAQQGVIGLLIFISLPAYILYVMFRSGFAQNKYMFPLIAGLFVQSLSINIENIRFVWYLLGVILAAVELGINPRTSTIQIMPQKHFKVAFSVCLVIFALLYGNVARHLSVNPVVYRGSVFSKQINTSGHYTLTFDVRTNSVAQTAEIDVDGLITVHEFSSPLDTVNLTLYVYESISISFISDAEGWMRINNAYLIGEDGKFALYRYPLLPRFMQNFLDRNNLLG